MPPYAVSVTKQITWRGQLQDFSNVYHFFKTAGGPSELAAILTAVVNAEKAIFSAEVNFVQGRTWGPTNVGPSGSETVEIRDLTGTGTPTADATVYKELATLIYWPLGRYGSRNRPQFLRKWLHLMRVPTGAAAGWINGNVQTTSDPAQVTTYINAVTSPATDWTICTPDAKTPTGPGHLYPYLEHRQLGR